LDEGRRERSFDARRIEGASQFAREATEFVAGRANCTEIRRAGRHHVRIDVFTIFPAMVDDFAAHSLIGKARGRGLLDVRVHDLRSGANDPHRSVDDSPFGGGAGMVLMPEPLFRSVESVEPPRPLILLGPGGRARARGTRRLLAAVRPV
jgi:hypothetical protein